MSATRTPIKSLTLNELSARLSVLGQPAFRAKQVAEWLYRKRARGFDEMTNLPTTLRQQLAGEFLFDDLQPVRLLGSDDSTRKFLFRLSDGALIESVLIPASPALYGSPLHLRDSSLSSLRLCTACA